MIHTFFWLSIIKLDMFVFCFKIPVVFQHLTFIIWQKVGTFIKTLLVNQIAGAKVVESITEKREKVVLAALNSN